MMGSYLGDSAAGRPVYEAHFRGHEGEADNGQNSARPRRTRDKALKNDVRFLLYICYYCFTAAPTRPISADNSGFPGRSHVSDSFTAVS